MWSSQSERRGQYMAGAVAVLGIISFSKLWGASLFAPFLREDSWLVFTAPPSFAELAFSVFRPVDDFWYHRPVRHAVIAAITFLFGPKPLPLHLVSWTCLLGAVLFFFLSLRRWYPRKELVMAFAFAFALSPVHAKTLYWASALHNHLALLFASAALWARLSFDARWPSLLLFVLACFSRETALGWVAALFVCDRLRGASWRRSWDLGAACVLVVAGIAASGVLGAALGSGQELFRFADPLWALIGHVGAVVGWTGADGSDPRAVQYNGAQLGACAFFFLYSAFLSLRAGRRKELLPLLPLSLAWGGLAVLLAHPKAWQPEYPVLFAFGLAAMGCDALHRALGHRRWEIFVIPCILTLASVNGIFTGAFYAQLWAGEASACNEVVRSFREAVAGKLRSGTTVLVEKIAIFDQQRDISGHCAIYLPQALSHANPGLWIVFSSELKGALWNFTEKALMPDDLRHRALLTATRARFDGDRWSFTEPQRP